MNTKVAHLQNPDKLALSNAYRSMPRNGEINLFISVRNLNEILSSMESAGFIGIEVIYLNKSSEAANIRAFKGKNGPCYDTGRYLVYNGAALAALDDDNHLLFARKQIPVCEKTANIYKLAAYEKLVACSDPDPVLLSKLNDEPVPFNCDTFESDHEKLFNQVKEPVRESLLVDLFYPGPFRLLIMDDGRIIHRGRTTSIPESEVPGLIEKDRLFRNSGDDSAQALYFKELYRLYGTRCLLNKTVAGETTEKDIKTDFDSLLKISDELKGHLVKLISENKKYFILKGSDTGDKLGCCPSETVTEANKLKRAGILDSFREKVPGESCSLTIYAFKNEIKIIDNEPHFTIDSSFRKMVLDKVEKNSGGKYGLVAKWLLLAFIAVTVIVALFKLSPTTDSTLSGSLYEQLIPGTENQSVIILFHYKERCSLCLNMEKFTNEVLTDIYPDLLKNMDISFKLLAMDDPANINMVERFKLSSAAIVMVKFENRKEDKIIVLKELWEYSQDETLFKDNLKKELENFLKDKYE